MPPTFREVEASEPRGHRLAGSDEPKIFVSYRRADSGDAAGRLYDRLEREFGAGRVFFDLESIDAGSRYRDEIRRAVRASAVMLVVIGPGWSGGTRLRSPGDLVRIEIEEALDADTTVIPVLVGGARMPAAHELPASIVRLAERNAFTLATENFRSAADVLVGRVDTLMRRKETTPRRAAAGTGTPRAQRPAPPRPVDRASGRVPARSGAGTGPIAVAVLAVLGGVVGVAAGGGATVLWLVSVVLVVAGIVALVRRQLLWGLLLVVVGLLVGPGGVSIFNV